MGIFKLIVAFIVIGAIGVIISEVFKRKNKEKMVEDLNDEMDTVNDSLHRTIIEEDVVDAKTKLKARRAELAEKEADLDKPTPPAERTAKEGEQPPKPAPVKKKVAKKKAVRKPGDK
jgi:uncharacterized membrane protein YraQ (UPF0718 family)